MAAEYLSGFTQRLVSVSRLTRRQAEVVFCVRKGMTNRRVAEHMEISPHTVGTYLRDIYRILEVSCRAELVACVDDLMTGESPSLRVPGSGDPTRGDT